MISLAVFHLLRTKVPTLPRQLLRCIEFHKIPQIIVISLFETFLLTWKLWCWKKWHLQNKILTKSFQMFRFWFVLYHNELLHILWKIGERLSKFRKSCVFCEDFFRIYFRLFFFLGLVCTCWQYSFCSSDTTDGFVISHLKIFHFI